MRSFFLKKFSETKEETEFDIYIIPTLVVIGILVLLHPLEEVPYDANIH